MVWWIIGGIVLSVFFVDYACCVMAGICSRQEEQEELNPPKK